MVKYKVLKNRIKSSKSVTCNKYRVWYSIEFSFDSIKDYHLYSMVVFEHSEYETDFAEFKYSLTDYNYAIYDRYCVTYDSGDVKVITHIDSNKPGEGKSVAFKVAKYVIDKVDEYNNDLKQV